MISGAITGAATVSVAGVATAAGTSFGAGLYGSVFMNYDTMSTTSTEQSLWNTASNVVADNGNITFNAGNDMLQEGSNVFAQNGTLTCDIGNDLIVRVIADTFSSETKSENKNAGVSAGNNAVQVNVGMGQSSNRIRSATYQNSNIFAENITIKTGNNATFSGANVSTSDTLYMAIGNNLTVESLQDTYYSKGNSWSASIGIGIGTGDMGKALGGNGKGQSNAGNNSGSIGFNVGKDRTDSAWVNNQTSLTRNNVAINVGTREEIRDEQGNIIQVAGQGKTTITGVIIAAESYDKDGNFQDNGNLALNTKSLTYNDINDFYKSKSKGFGLSTSGGTSSNAGETSAAPKGSTTLSVKSTGEEREQSTRATIGQGAITTGVQSYAKDENGNLVAVGGTVQTELAGLNRDVNKSQEITKDMITGALDGSVTVDNRILMGFMSTGKTQATDKDGKPVVDKDGNPVMRDVSGFESVANDFINLRSNTAKAAMGAFSTAVSPIKAIYSSLTSDKNDSSKGENAQNNKKDIITAWKANQSSNTTGILRGGNQDVSDIVDKVKKGTASPE